MVTLHLGLFEILKTDFRGCPLLSGDLAGQIVSLCSALYDTYMTDVIIIHVHKVGFKEKLRGYLGLVFRL